MNVLEAKIFRYDFLEGHNMWQNNCYWSQRNVVATKPECLVTKHEMLVVFATISVKISRPRTAFKILCLC